MMETIELRVVAPAQAQAAAEILHDALPLPDRLWQIINDPTVVTYEAHQDGELVAGAIVRWRDESEIEVLGVHRSKRRQGIGQAVVAALVDEAISRGVGTLVVGTSSIALDNIMFYQKCGFRMSHVRRNYFAEAYPELQIEWQGVKLLDMIVFDFALTGQTR